MKWKTLLQLEHLNVRREKDGDDDGPVATDLKLTGTVKAEALLDLFSTQAAFDYALGSLYRPDGEMVTHDIARILLAREGIGVQVRLATEFSEPMDFEGAILDRIKLKPLPGRSVEVCVRVVVKPRPAQLAQLADSLGQDLTLDISQRQSSLALDEPPAPAVGKPRQRAKAAQPAEASA